jgi:hypothetical protein
MLSIQNQKEKETGQEFSACYDGKYNNAEMMKTNMAPAENFTCISSYFLNWSAGQYKFEY